MQPVRPRRPRLTLDMAMWVFTRVSGAAIIAIALIGFFGAMLMGARTQMDLPTLLRWTFFPNPNHVVNSNIPDVAAGWSGPFWQTLQILIVIFGATHGLNGLRAVIEDHVRGPRVTPAIRAALFVAWLVVMVVAVAVVLAD